MSRALAVLFGVTFIAALVCPAVALADDTVRLNVTQIDPSDFPNVRVVASAVDAQGKPVKGLQASDLIVSESSRAQRIGVDLANTATPIALVLVLDTSGSMAGKPFADAKAAMNALAQSLGPKDQAAIVTFNTAVTIAQPLTSDKAALAAAIDRATAGGDTAIFDALSAATDLIAPVPPSSRRGIVLLTDGIDNSSRTTTLAGASAKVTALKAPVYVIGLGSDLDRPVLQALADGSTGGAAYVAPTSAQLAGIYAGLSEQIATEYVVSYRSDIREVAAGTTLELTLQLIRAGSVIATTTASFVVPIGHDVKPAAVATVEPAPAREQPAVPVIGSTRVAPMLVALLGAGSALCLLLWALVLSTTQSLAERERRRMNELAGGLEPLLQPGARPFRDRVIVPFLQRLARPFQRFMPSSERTRLRLAQAGDPLDLGPAEFLGLRVASAFIFAIVSVVIAAAFQIDLLLLLATLLGLFLGYAIPGIALGRAIRGRQRAIQRALPAALDMLALSASAGLTFDGAVGQVVERWQTPLSDELRRLLVEFRMGSDRRVALRGLARRTGLADVGRFVNAIIQADSLGVPISKVLSEQAGEMRTRRRQRAEEAARTAPVKMLFPLVGLIFPALFVVILGPAVPRFLTLFANAH